MDTAKTTPARELRKRVMVATDKFTKDDYMPLYVQLYGEQSPEMKQRIRSVWNMRTADPEITENIEKLVQHHLMS